MAYLHVSDSRLFARIHSFTIGCPQCGECCKVNKQERGPGAADSRSYQPRTQEWRCPGCRLRLVLGVLAWMPSGGAQNPPSDAVANLLQGMRLTEKYGSRLSAERKQEARAKVNKLVAGEPVGTPPEVLAEPSE